MAEYLGKTGLAYLWGKIKSNFASSAHTHTGADLRPVAATSSDGVSYTATVPGLTELYAGLTLTIIPDKASTVITPTLNVNGLGAKIIIMPVGGVNTAVTTNAAKLFPQERPLLSSMTVHGTNLKFRRHLLSTCTGLPL